MKNTKQLFLVAGIAFLLLAGTFVVTAMGMNKGMSRVDNNDMITMHKSMHGNDQSNTNMNAIHESMHLDGNKANINSMHKKMHGSNAMPANCGKN